MDDSWVLSKLYQLLGRRPKTTKEISEWMKKRSVSEEQQARILEKLTSMGLLNDIEFTHAFIRTQKLIKPLSVKQLTNKLQKKGIKPSIVKEVLEEEGYSEEEAALNELRKSQWKWKNVDQKLLTRKQMEFLSRKGFSFDLIKKVMKKDE